MDQTTSSRGRAADGADFRVFHKYLRDRYAHTVVLTFDQIEDLLGSPLPEAARRSATWWTDAGAGDAAGSMAEAWIQAKRTAVPNLSARIVTFERVSM